jgi:hypothetical protein
MKTPTFATVMLGALLCGLTLAASASAGCAWVLWSGEWSGTKVEPLNMTERAFDSKAECEEERRTIVMLVRSAEGASGKKSTRGHWYACLPDTVDPRAPKASGR